MTRVHRERFLFLLFVTTCISASLIHSDPPVRRPVPTATVAPRPTDPSTTDSTTSTAVSTTSSEVHVVIASDVRPPVDNPPSPAASGGGSAAVFLVTCYTLRGTGASGRQVGPGSVAVDPSVIPLGRSVHVDGMGTYRADDTGGAIRGYRLDLWMSSTQQCLNFGKQELHVEW